MEGELPFLTEEKAVASRPDPDRIEPQSPPEFPVLPEPIEAPDVDVPGVAPVLPDIDIPDPGRPEIAPDQFGGRSGSQTGV